MKKVTVYLLGLAFLASCSTSNEVVNNGLFQKRKYNKGWYVNKSSTIGKSKSVDKNEDIAYVIEKSTENEAHTNLVSFESNTVKSNENSSQISKESENNNTQRIEKITVKIEEVNKEENVEDSQITLINKSHQHKTSETFLIPSPQKISSQDKKTGGAGSSTNTLLLIIIAFFISWLSVGIYTGWETTPTLINLALWLLGGSLYFGVGSLGGLLFILAIVHAILIILGVI